MCYVCCDVIHKKGDNNEYEITDASYDIIFDSGFSVRSFLECNVVCRRTGSVHVIYSREHRECVCDHCEPPVAIAAYHSSGAPINIQEVIYGGNSKTV